MELRAKLEERPAIRFSGVNKRYRMGGDFNDKIAESLGLSRLFRRKPRQRTEFDALHEITFEVPRGRRYGLIGRNGAGKTTLLKLISGNFAPTSGVVEVHGSVQALMTMGHGFHPDYSGRDNIAASLQYNGLNRTEFREAVDEIIDFCELGSFIDQPFKTYSTGMQARLMFATATAVKPDILIVDEVLGAGDAYFVAKSRLRVDKLVNSGCTLLLVSHSMSQILELCERVMWLDNGRIRQMDDAFKVVKAYEEWMHGSIERLDQVIAKRTTVVVPADRDGAIEDATADEVTSDNRRLADDIVANEESAGAVVVRPSTRPRPILLQLPTFQPHAAPAEIPEVGDEASRNMVQQAPGGISRWGGESGLRIVGVTISGPQGPTDRLVSLQPARFSIFLKAETDGPFRCTYGIAIHDLKGRAHTRIWSPPDRFDARRGDGRRVEMVLNPNQLGPGTYTLGISILEETELELVNSAKRFDLLSRSFLLHVELADSLTGISADFFHSAEWHMRACVLGPDVESDEVALSQATATA
jgi:lipopolysaccharide transport system ATP-binding protein